MPTDSEHTPTLYTIEVVGQLSTLWDERLDTWRVAAQPGGTSLITGSVRDQTELYGVLAALRNMGLTLLRVEPSIPVPPASSIPNESQTITEGEMS
ncbi:MAG: hypothetical protein LC641_07300 [Spirochaeta sp.]|nr:hypothetical protein [Spirochaeta sp.]